MDRTREEEIGRKVRKSPAMEFLDPSDPWGHAQLEIIRRMCVAFDDAMNLEDIPSGTRSRVVNQVLYGDPDGLEDVYRQRMEMWMKELTRVPAMPDLDDIMRMPPR